MTGAKLVGGEYEFDTATARATITKGDLIHYKTNGRVAPVAAGEPIAGVALEDASSGDTVRFAKGYRLRVLMDNDNTGTTFAASHVGGRFDVTGATGAQVVDTSTVAQAGTDADTGQLICIAYNPQGYGVDDDTSVGLYEIVERQ